MGETGAHLHVAPHQVSHARPLRVLARVCTPRLLLAHQGACAAGRRGCERGGRQAGGGRQPGGSSACTVAQPLKPLHSQHQLLPVAVVVAHGVQAGARVEAAHGAREPGVVVWPVHPHPTPVGSLARARDAGCQVCVGATGGRDTGGTHRSGRLSCKRSAVWVVDFTQPHVRLHRPAAFPLRRWCRVHGMPLRRSVRQCFRGSTSSGAARRRTTIVAPHASCWYQAPRLYQHAQSGIIAKCCAPTRPQVAMQALMRCSGRDAAAALELMLHAQCLPAISAKAAYGSRPMRRHRQWVPRVTAPATSSRGCADDATATVPLAAAEARCGPPGAGHAWQQDHVWFSDSVRPLCALLPHARATNTLAHVAGVGTRQRGDRKSVPQGATLPGAAAPGSAPVRLAAQALTTKAGRDSGHCTVQHAGLNGSSPLSL